MNERAYIAIDLKSFYASVECRERGLDPMTTLLVVADEARTAKTICLAATPAIKTYGVPGRSRLFEVQEKIRQANGYRRGNAGSSWNAKELQANPSLKIDYLVAKPRMALYMDYSTRIYDIYRKYVAPEDIHVYSIDEVFMDVTHYLRTYRMTPRELARRIIGEIYAATGITATAGIGTNLYLSKIALDIMAKHCPADANGARIAELDEMTYRQRLWSHRPLTDFWRVGRGYARKLEENGLYTMGDIARCSVGGPCAPQNAERLYQLFGVNAELLIDHAWGWEPCTIADIKAYRPESSSLSSGQVLQCGCDFRTSALIMREMAESLSLDLVDKRLVTDQIVLTVGYDIENLSDPERAEKYDGPVEIDHYGRKVPKAAHGSINLPRQTSSARLIIQAAMMLYQRIVHADLLVRRMYIVANHVVDERCVDPNASFQVDMFTHWGPELTDEQLAKEQRHQQAVLEIRKKYGKNAILRGMNLQEGATARERNQQIGGHKA